MTEAELDARYDEIVAKYPQGINMKQFTRIALESADEDGRIYPHPVGDWWLRQSIMLRLFFEGLIQSHSGRNPGAWYITEKGRDWLKQHDDIYQGDKP